MSVTFEVPAGADPARRRGVDGGAVIPFPRAVEPGGAPGAAKPAHPVDHRAIRRAGPRSRPTGRSTLPPTSGRRGIPAAVSGDEVRVGSSALDAPERLPVRTRLAVVESYASVTRLDRRRSARPGDAVTVVDVAASSAPARLTRRGRLVLLVLASLTVAALLAVVAPGLGSRPAGPAAVPAGAAAPVVVVEPGDTLWSIARRVAPDRDARLVVADLRRINALSSADVRVGQELRLGSP